MQGAGRAGPKPLRVQAESAVPSKANEEQQLKDKQQPASGSKEVQLVSAVAGTAARAGAAFQQLERHRSSTVGVCALQPLGHDCDDKQELCAEYQP